MLPPVKGSAVLFDDKNERIFPIQVRPRFTWHGGSAPIAIKEKKEMLERQKAVLIQRQEEEIIKVHQLTGAIAILNEQLQEQVLNGKVKEKTGA